jgi:hypothetical protein
MNYRLFQYPLPGPPELEDLNAYLGSHRVASVTQHIAQAAGGAMLVFIVQTVAGEAPGKGRSPEAKVDYREVLSAEDFQVFSRLRDERKTIAEAEGVPVYAVFNDSIPHGLLRERLARRFGERRLLALFDALLESHHHTPGRGLPIGALTSQYLGNFHLDAFDHWVNQRQKLPRYLRYMDDLFFLADHFTLRRLLPEAVALLDGLGLRVKDGGVLNRCETGVPWLGFVLYPDRTRLILHPGRDPRGGTPGALGIAVRARGFWRRCGVAAHGRAVFKNLGCAGTRIASCAAGRGTTRRGIAAPRSATGTRPTTATGTTASGSVWFPAR